MRAVVSFVAIAALAGAALAQSRVDHDPAFDGSAVVAMVGEWKGSGWSQMGPGERSEFEATERVRWHLSGRALIVEGLGTAADPESGTTIIGHDAMAVIRFDEESGTWRFFAGRGGAALTDHELEIVDADAGVMRWSPDSDHGDVRFTITVVDDRWLEVGEFSPDSGATWMKFLEMTLERVE